MDFIGNIAVNNDAQLMEEYFSRLSRFFGRPEYDNFHIAVAGGRLLHRVAYALARVSVQHPLTAIIMIGLLYFVLPGLRCIPKGDVLFFGETQNNQRALGDVAALLGKRCDLVLISHPRPAGRIERLRRWRAFADICRAGAMIARFRPSTPFLALQLLMGGAAYAFYQNERALQAFRMIALANDHSPTPTAVMFAARRHGVATVYRQHAPVTPEFPPLRCDLALLYDQASSDAYGVAASKDIEPSRSHVVIVSPFDKDYRRIDPRRPLARVGICLSLVWTADSVQKLLDELLTLSTVERIVFRPHPANRADLDRLVQRQQFMVDPPGTSASSFASTIDFAVVPNSGICIELLHCGVPVIYRAGLDALGHDLYGFVRAGIVPDYTDRPLTEIGDLYAFYNADWQRRFARFDATQLQTPSAMRAEARQALHALL